MRVANWSPQVFDELVEVAYKDLLTASYVVKDETVRRLRGIIGTKKTTGISRPVYKKGAEAGKKYTAREFGQLLKSVRVVEKKEQYGTVMMHYKNIWIMCGNYLAFYAAIIEFSSPFMRPALESKLSEIKQIMGVK